ncbi:VOC family protein [Miniimonas arenae]|uniref:VOC family protein n=1 Tax=Miniimonas arenae TaxID=676201 RepID=A0A5C5BB90_9MICO|nr:MULTISPECIES: VOC family protein [Miniimonas]TNU73983.1 VOC family protein [Miniimonas arenae]
MSDDGEPLFRATAAVLDAPDPEALARFYGELLGWTVTVADPTWVTVRPPSGMGLSVQREERYVAPVWPAGEGDQQMQLHLDVEVTDLARGVERALALGARLAEWQPQEDVRVLLDPVGHPFCLWIET